MDDDNKVGLQTDPNDIRNIERLIQSVDKLTGSLEHLAAGSRGMTDLKQAMQVMQATMVTGFTELSIAAKKSDDAIVDSRIKSKDKLLAEEVKAWDKLFHTSQAALSRLEAQQDVANARRLEKAATARVRELELEITSENKRAAALQAIMEKRDIWLAEDRAKQIAADAAAQDKRLTMEISAENRRAAALQVAMEKQDLWMAEERGRQYAAAVTQATRLEALAASSAEKQRLLNSSFLTSSLPSQISTAERAAVYAGMGGNAGDRFGSAAAAADIAALRAQYALLPTAQRAAAEGATVFNKAMGEGHALARGLSGSLGALWLTYGSLAPLAAGAAIGASLKNIVTVGKEVEYQLKFVEALGNAPVKVDDFLKVTDGTVVSVKEAAEGMRALAQNGLDAAQSLQILPTILNLAVIGEMSVNAAALSATGVLSAFNLTLNDAARVGDVFAQAAASSNTSVALMTESMKQASTVASLYHVTLEETAAGLGQLAKINITGSAAGTAFTNMLTGLYSPTNKAQQALEKLGITTDDGKGGLKEMTVLLGELRGALSQYNESTQAVFLNDIFTTRGTKAASQLLSNFEEYKLRIEDAANSTGFMSAAVAKLEDSTEGAFKRMKNNITSSLVESFQSASPGIQALITDLGTLAGSQGAKDTLTGLADATLRLTNTLVENGKVIGTVAAAYVLMRTTATLATVATAQATATTTAGFLATSAAATTLAGSLRLLVASLGWISLAFAAAVTVYELFINKTSDAEKADQRLRNSIDTNIEFIKRETDALNERNKAWNPETQQFDKKPEAQTDLSALQQRVANAQKIADTQAPARSTNVAEWTEQRLKNLRDLRAAQNELHAVEMGQAFLSEQLDEERARKTKANVLIQIEDLVRKGQTETTINGKLVQLDEQGNAKSRAIALEAKGLQADLLAGKLTAKQAEIELLAKRQEYNAALKAAPEGEDKRAARDKLNAAIAEVAQAKELLKIRQQTAEISLKEDNKQGRLGDLGLLQAQVALQQQSAAATIAQARADIELVSGVENKRAATQKYYNQLAVGREQEKQNALQAQINTDAIIDSLRQQNLKAEADNLAKRGELLDSFLLDYEAKYSRTLSRVAADMLNVQDALARDGEDPFADPEATARLRAYNDELTRYVANMAQAKTEGTNTAIFNQVRQQLDGLLSTMSSALSEAKAAGNDEGGLSGAIGVGQAAQNIKDNLLPQITELQGKLNTLSKGTPALEKLAADSSKKISNEVLAISKASQPFGDAWTNIWKGVENSAHDTWLSIGKSGTDTLKKLGETIKTSILDMIYQLTVKKWIIQIGAVISDAGGGNLLSGAASLFGVSGGAGAGGGAAGSAGSLLNLVSTGRNIYNAFTATGSGTLGAWLSGASSVAPTSVAAANAVGAVGGDSLGTLIAAEGWSTGAGAAGTGAASAGTSGLGAFGGIAAGAAAGILGGNAISGGYSGIGHNPTNATATGAAIGAAVGSIVPVIGTAIGALVGGLLGGLYNRAFGSKEKEITGTGVRGTLTEEAVTNGESYSQWLKKGGWFKSDKRGEDVTTLASEFQNSLVSGLVQVRTLTESFGKTMGLDTSSLDGYSKQFDIKLDPKDSSKNAQAITDLFTSVSDELATKLIPNIKDFAKVGETAGTTLERLGKDFQSTNVIAQLLGKTATEAFGAAGLASIAARERFIDMSGGIDALSSKLSSYSQNYLTTEEQSAPVIAALNEAFEKLNLKVPTTRDEFKALVSGLDLTDAAQVKTFNSLMDLQEAFAQVHPVIDKVAEASKETSDLLALQAQIYELTGNASGAAAVLEQQHALALKDLSPAMQDLTKQLWAAQAAAKVTSAQDNLLAAYQSQKSALESVISTSKQFSQSMKDLAKSLQQGELSTLTPEQKLAAARDNYEDLLARAKGGDKDAQSKVGQAAQDFLTADRAYNASNSVYAKDADKVQKDLATLAASADAEIPIAEAQLDALTKQVSSLVKINDSLTQGFIKVQEAILALASAMGNAGQGVKGPDATDSVINSLYQTLLGRPPDKEGADFWKSALDSGATIPSIVDGFKSSDEYLGNQVEKLYGSILGRESDAAGKDHWVDALRSGVSIDKITSDFYNSAEYLSSHGKAHAYGGVAGAGAALVGENGPEVAVFREPARIYGAGQTAGMFAPNQVANSDTSYRLQALEVEARADKVQRAAIAEQQAKLQQRMLEELGRIRAAQRAANATTRGSS